MFYKIVSGICPNYLRTLLPPKQPSYNLAKTDRFRNIRARTEYFENSFFPFCVKAWNQQLGEDLKSASSISSFKNGLLAFIRPKMNSVYNIHDPHGLKLLTRLRVNFSHLREHKFRHNFRDTINPLCSCGLEVENNNHYLLRCPFFSQERKVLLDSISVVVGAISHLPDEKLTDLLLYGKDSLTSYQNAFVLRSTILFLKASGRFDVPLL